MTRSAKTAREKPVERKLPVLQRFQVQQIAGQFYVADTQRMVVAGGPFKIRTRAQHEADRLERGAGGS
jgi:hypothetical protein